MIHISQPHLEYRNSNAFLVSDVRDEKRSLETELWFSVDKEYGRYLCDNNADSFLLVVLPIAIKTEQDVIVDAPVSTRLLFNIQNTLIPIYKKIFAPPILKDINIKAKSFDGYYYQAKGVGCGCSLGVDSLSSFLKHFSKDTIPEYKVTHLTLFNSGQLGDYELDKVEEYFRKSVEELKPFSKAVGLPIVAVNSNLNAFYKFSGVTLLQSFVIRTVACALTLQKLFGKYVYASSYTVEQFNFSSVDQSHMESSYVPLLGTENMEMILSNPMLTRVAKTEYISKSPLTSKFLKVCWAEQTAYEIWHNTAFLENKTKTNCGWCDKCLRTLLTLEVLGCDLNDYGETFELSRYYEHKRDYISKIFKEYEYNVFYREIIDLIIEKKYPVPYYVLKRHVWKNEIRRIAKRVLQLPSRIMNKIRRFIKR